MTRQVLVVDHSRRLFMEVRRTLRVRGAGTEAISASSTGDAMEILERAPVTLIVSDLRIHQEPDVSFIRHVNERFVDIMHLITCDGHSREMEALLNQLDGKEQILFFRRPYAPQSLADRIIEILERQKDGGTLFHVSVGMVLQLVQMEQRSCIVRIFETDGGGRGTLFFRKGSLLDAWTLQKRGERAAHDILSWEDASLMIQNGCHRMENRIHAPLQALLLEAMRLKDERDSKRKEKGGEPPAGAGEAPVDTPHPRPLLGLRAIREQLARNGFFQSVVINIAGAASWNALIGQADRLGSLLGMGEPRLIFMDRNEDQDYLLVCGKEPVVLTLKKNSPREKLIQFLQSLE